MNNNEFVHYHPVSVKNHLLQPEITTRPYRPRRLGICLVVRGSGQVSIGPIQYSFEAGSCLVFPTRTRVQLHTYQEQVELYYLSIGTSLQAGIGDPLAEGEAASSLEDPFSDLHRPVLQFPQPAAMLSAVQQLETAMKDHSPPAYFLRQKLMYECLLHLWDQRVSELGTNGNDSIQKTIDYMKHHYQDPIQLGDLPKLAGLTPSSYCRAFKKVTGCSPGEYLTQLRIERAKELFRLPNPVLRDIASQIGFQDEHYFSRVFKKLEGVSPTLYMKRNNKRIAVISSMFLQDHLLALGMEPIAAPSYPSYFSTTSGFPSYLQNKLRNTQAVNVEVPISSGVVQGLQADLIFHTPLPIQPDGGTHFEADTVHLGNYFCWKEYQRHIAKELDKEKEGERIIRRLEGLEYKARKRLSGIGQSGSWAILRVHKGELRLYGTRQHALSDLLYRGLGFQPHEAVNHNQYAVIPLEELVILDPDHILIVWTEKEEFYSLQCHSLWKELSAVQRNRVYTPNSREWDPWGPYGRETMLQGMVSYFEQRA